MAVDGQALEAGLGREVGHKPMGFFDFLAARPGELVLDHIVERKRLDDLCSSIIDGRFREQKVPLLALLALLFLPASGPPPQPKGSWGALLGVLKAEPPWPAATPH